MPTDAVLEAPSTDRLEQPLDRGRKARRELHMALKYSGVAMLGFGTDLVLLQAGALLGARPFAARAVSLFMAMQVTFLANGCLVFRCLTRERCVRQWLRYMGSNAIGNFANYWVFLTLLSLHMAVFSNHLFALCAGGVSAWAINYVSTRWLVFTKKGLAIAHHAHDPQSEFCD
ncbi:MAG: GtrA family protein [Proteobacteria bacterium]|nr:GtrA family protein [Pseudomonadota bacterium]